MCAFLLPKFVGQYELEELIGHGSTSYVYRGHKRPSKVDVAIKAIPKSKIQGSADIRHLQAEIDVTFNINHRNIVKVLDYLDDTNYHYIVFEYCPNGSLLDYIIRNRLLKAQEAGHIFYQILHAILFLHRNNIIHRDIKPSNILLTTVPNIKVTDFGLCGFVSEKIDLLTYMGSPCYQPPEVIRRLQYDGKKWDTWSLGVTLYEMVTGSHPWTISNASLMITQISAAEFSIPDYVCPDMARVIRSMIQANPDDRISLEALAEDPYVKSFGQHSKIRKFYHSQSSSFFRNGKFNIEDQPNQKFGQFASSIISPFNGKYRRNSLRSQTANFRKDNKIALETTVPMRRYRSSRIFDIDC
ncbi:CAMK family protein kinase [Tritrichomonas foetus]|uniref:CAMK family protein kinase n=1 Tax=Tritrichomonas foetus TaxID=1144522 RepID=A0A1J4KVY8_9EUKA|nr:CAMK family protein kinase [Tritrichomonas foetus]|eukprot:OHT13916.1 CAMK family protein kinase [Tritrichomonas foetus]